MKFTKMHGIGNDYIYVNCFEEQVEHPSEVSKHISHRNYGIGADGLILIKPSKTADCCMDMYNADGSRGAMCGNGIRCVGKYVYEHKLVNKTELSIETASGIKHLSLEIENGKVTYVTVDMGIPGLEPTDESVWESIELEDGSLYQMIPVSMGNPHAVVFMDDLKDLDIQTIGPKFENHPRFPDRTNTEFAQIIDRSHIKMRVWERGSGETLACGTGACALAVASVLAGMANRTVEIELLGGILQVTWDQESGHVKMRGTATEVYHGEIDIEEKNNV